VKKTLYILREMIFLIRTRRLWLLAIILLVLCFVSFFVYQVTPATIVTFIYAGI
jgi:hypothetical protein